MGPAPSRLAHEGLGTPPAAGNRVLCDGLVPGADPRPGKIPRFWFGVNPGCVPPELQKRWFAKTPAFDAPVCTRCDRPLRTVSPAECSARARNHRRGTRVPAEAGVFVLI